MQASLHVRKWLFCVAVSTALAGCTFLESFAPKPGDGSDIIDRQQHLSVDDFRDLNNKDKLLEDGGEVKPTAALGATPLPNLAQVLAAPHAPKVANTKLVTLAVTEDVPLRDVLFELGRLASVDIEVGGGLGKKGINLQVTDKPFNEVIERIADLAGLRYSLSGGSIRVEKDTPYIKNYSLDFLNLVRSSTSDYSLSTSILSGASSGSSSSSSSSSSSDSGSSSGGSSGGGGVGTSGSSTAIEGKADSDLWGALEASIGEIVAAKSAAEAAIEDDAGAANSGNAASPPPPISPVGGSQDKSTTTKGVTVNRQAGVISVYASERQHQMVQHFLTLMSRNASAQVLIEAKIVEVQLIDQFLSGVDWNSILGDARRHYVNLGNYSPLAVGSLSLTSASFAAGIDHGQLESVIKATQRFGTTRTLSSPRLAAINNQQAILTFARNEVFYDCTITPAVTTTGTTTTTNPATVNCTARSVPIGIILNILPSINSDSQEVTLSVRPTLTRKVGDAENPQLSLLDALNGTSTPATVKQTTPIIEVRELDSIMKVRSGGIMIIGGLMEDASNTQSDGVPAVSEVPLFGNLFKSRSENSSKRELIILIKATIMNSTGNASSVDRAVYEKYTTDPRPAFPQ